ncbi:hypothetical protein M9H77_32491 [Catharanthus roseus]|uniref:Uncharacterized protein n=1 Tax=Catharanthus roseus TaxID=4058 RepID=A0ACC0A531_CATRO|nr:hypothetical protein M9H77_32491 [Catharanthus roseus]
MVSTETIRTAVGITGNIISFALFLSPLPTLIQIRKKKSVEQYSVIPYIATILNCGLWFLYSMPMVHPHSILLATVNGIGLIIELLYAFFFIFYSDSKKKRLRVMVLIFAEFLFIAILALLVLNLASTTKQRSAIVGSICTAGNIMMYASPLAIMKLVITTKSVEYMPLFVSLASFANSVNWTAYAFYPFDPFIVVPNGVGAVFGLTQLLLYARFYKSTRKQLAQEDKTEVGLAKKPICENYKSTMDKNGCLPQAQEIPQILDPSLMGSAVVVLIKEPLNSLA